MNGREGGIDPRSLNPLNRRSLKLAWLIMSGIPNPVPNFITIRSGVSVPRPRAPTCSRAYEVFLGSGDAVPPSPLHRFLRSIGQITRRAYTSPDTESGYALRIRMTYKMETSLCKDTSIHVWSNFRDASISSSADVSWIVEKCPISQCWRILQGIPGSGSGGRWHPKFNQFLLV